MAILIVCCGLFILLLGCRWRWACLTRLKFIILIFHSILLCGSCRGSSLLSSIAEIIGSTNIPTLRIGHFGPIWWERWGLVIESIISISLEMSFKASVSLTKSVVETCIWMSSSPPWVLAEASLASPILFSCLCASPEASSWVPPWASPRAPLRAGFGAAVPRCLVLEGFLAIVDPLTPFAVLMD